jgi:RNA polymerase sigma-70 factor (ECF subfamily)
MDIARLVADHHEAVYRYAYRLTGSQADAEDLTQQVFLQAQEKLGQLRSDESVRSWLFAILRNFFLKSCDKRQRLPTVTTRLDVDAIAAEPAREAAIDREDLQAALNELPPHFRIVVTMFYYEGCSYREIAERLDLPMGTVMSRLSRAKEHLRTRLFAPDTPARPDKELALRKSVAGQRG